MAVKFDNETVHYRNDGTYLYTTEQEIELLRVNVLEKLTAARTYYVRTDGSDSNNGLTNSSGGAFLTLQKAWDTILTLNLAGFAVTVQIADGTYTGALNCVNSPVGGAVTFQGNSGTPANVILSVTSNNAIAVAYRGDSLTIKDMEIRTTTSGAGLIAYDGGNISFTNVRFGACATAQIYTTSNGGVRSKGSYAISGAAPYHFLAQSGGTITVANVTCTISGTPAFSTAFAAAEGAGVVTSVGMTWSGSATGVRYIANTNGVVQTFGSGATYFPGGTAGSTATGGVYA